MRVTSVTRWDEGEFRVEYEGAISDGRLFVHAKDEIDAFMRAEKLLKEREVNERYGIIAATLCVLALFALAGYACSQPRFDELCVQSGKTYVNKTSRGDTPDIEACI